jgi:methylated-DNA-[protein]-cysteine S-methyltransferase
VIEYTFMPTPIGRLLLTADGAQLCGVRFAVSADRCEVHSDWRAAESSVLGRTRAQLEGYFAGERRTFDIPLARRGTAFQQSVWRELERIPYGVTISYAELARRLGKASATRAVGAANGRNPIPIIIPCHRVIGADGSLTGFGGGLGVKQFLLELEGALQTRDLFSPVPGAAASH